MAADFIIGHLTAVAGAGHMCGTSQVLLAGMSSGFPQGTPVFAAPTDWLISI